MRTLIDSVVDTDTEQAQVAVDESVYQWEVADDVWDVIENIAGFADGCGEEAVFVWSREGADWKSTQFDETAQIYVWEE